ncbi:hypothetical protein LOK49_LG10G01357 [Camellia lanceoleosa]|uniref:Uncharacterized protein n=1 Tax=Camellia lanceoleosa TaxID=1840588 RepID=A0ACC0G5E5_9ERIC|nr:hypothetical protein LOK49_LG10G01357 [Camellia lanceoleosa]
MTKFRHECESLGLNDFPTAERLQWHGHSPEMPDWCRNNPVCGIYIGWQPGIQEGAADWDENWDNFEDEGFTFVKELTLDVQNVIAPPKPKSSPLQNKASSAKEGVTDVSSSNADQKSETSNADGKSETFNADRKSETLPTGEERIPDDTHNEEGVTRNPPDSPTPALGSPSKKFQNSPSRKNFNADGSPHAAETLSEHGVAESVLSGDRSFDEPSWGTFDTHYDTDSVWDFGSGPTKVETGGNPGVLFKTHPNINKELFSNGFGGGGCGVLLNRQVGRISIVR